MLLSILEHADEPIRRKKITETLNARGKAMKNCAVYEMLSQMAKDGQVKTLGRYVYSSFQEDA